MYWEFVLLSLPSANCRWGQVKKALMSKDRDRGKYITLDIGEDRKCEYWFLLPRNKISKEITLLLRFGKKEENNGVQF